MQESILQDKYLLERKLQEGKFGNTYLSRDDKNNKFIIKFVSLKKSDLVNKVPLLEQEAKIISHLNHPQIPKFIDFFTNETEDKINVYFVQEYIESKNLQELIEQKHMEFNETQIIKIVMGVCNILKYIHSFSPPIIHQDIKPANILFTKDEKVYLIDFGAVKQKIISIDDAGLSTVIGTHGYMPIEQFEGRAVKGSDIYSLGLTILYMITRKDPLMLDKKGLKFDLKKISISQGLRDVIEKMVEPDCKKRYQTVRELEEDLISITETKNLNLPSSKNFYNSVKSELGENEKLKWFGTSHQNLFEAIFSEHKYLKIGGIFIFMIKISLFTLMALASFFIFSLILINSIRKPNSLINKIRFRKETYIISDQRIIINKKTLKKSITKTYNFSDIKEISISDKFTSGKGNLLVRRKSTAETFKLKSLENVDLVYKIINDAIKEHQNDYQINLEKEDNIKVKINIENTYDRTNYN